MVAQVVVVVVAAVVGVAVHPTQVQWRGISAAAAAASPVVVAFLSNPKVRVTLPMVEEEAAPMYHLIRLQQTLLVNMI
jgi:hypothetical protein